jgi:excinuclease ABC subunit C
MFDIKEELKKLPSSSGVYIMHDEKDEIIYVGKAINLKNRVSSYFRENINHSDKIKRMVSLIAWFEYIITENELEALVLENNLIKKNKPKFNTLLKDDKTYPFIKITNEEFPIITTCRKIENDSAKYYGPFANVAAVNNVIEFINNTYNIRNCSYKNLPNKSCIYYQMKKCIGPCINKDCKKEYDEIIKEICKFFSGKYQELIKENKKLMENASDEMRFEDAIKYRDIIKNIEYIFNKQRITRANDEDIDVISILSKDNNNVVVILFVRDGKIIERDNFFLTDDDLESFIYQYYENTSFIPNKIYINKEIENINLLEKYLLEKRGRKVLIQKPLKGKNLDLIKLAEDNCKVVINQNVLKEKKNETKDVVALNEIKEITGLKEIKRIESFDISNTNGAYQVASMVVYENGNLNKKAYRKFKLSTKGPNDIASIKEVIERRFTDNKLGDFPDILFIDGGLGQINATKEILESLKINIPIVGMVKDNKHKTRGIIFEEKEYSIKKSINFVTRIQDETHRFAIEYHRKLRSDNMIKSVLDEIPGVGEIKKKALYEHFKDIESIKNASLEELLNVKKIDKNTAKNIYDYFRKNKTN